MGSLAALREGIRLVHRAPMVLVGVWATTLVGALLPALAMRDALATSLGDSLAADSAASGVNYEWMQEFASGPGSLASTFRPAIIGAAATLDNLSTFLDNGRQPIVMVLLITLSLLAWLFLAGGVIDRYARDRPTLAPGFFAASGVYLLRFLRLAVVMAIAYGLLFGVVHGWLFGRLFTRLTREMTVERTAFLVRLGLYGVFGCALAACNIVFDYAKVRAVVEDRRSMIGAIGAAIRFILRNSGAAIGLYVLDVLLFGAIVAAYEILAPGAGGAAAAWLGFFLGQLYIAARLWMKLVFWASAIALFQGRLAHAGYVSGPRRGWPEPPSAEAVLRQAGETRPRASDLID